MAACSSPSCWRAVSRASFCVPVPEFIVHNPTANLPSSVVLLHEQEGHLCHLCNLATHPLPPASTSISLQKGEQCKPFCTGNIKTGPPHHPYPTTPIPWASLSEPFSDAWHIWGLFPELSSVCHCHGPSVETTTLFEVVLVQVRRVGTLLKHKLKFTFSCLNGGFWMMNISLIIAPDWRIYWLIALWHQFLKLDCL